MGSEIVQGSPGRTAEAASADNSRAQNTPTTPSVAGRKRSLSPLSATSPAYARTTPATSVTKYYAVRTGRKPGIYYSWNDCRAQVGGFKGARYKSFTTLADADAFVRGTQIDAPLLLNPAQSAPASKSGEKLYGVRAGKKPGVYVNWSDAKAQIIGFKNPKYRKFDTREAADSFVKYGNPYGLRDSEGLRPQPPKDEEGKEIPAGEGPLPEGAVDGFDPNVVLDPVSGDIKYKDPEQHKKTKLQPKDNDEMLNIYTDGSSLSNGRIGAQAGVGVYFGPGDERNVSEPLEGKRQTNQRAELTAVLRALEIAPRSRDVRIFTDSRYSIMCVTEWFQKWRSNGWKNASNKPVENKDLISSIIDKIEERDSLGSKTLFEWVKGHNNDPGNEAADQLAVDGARRVLKPGEEADIA